MNPKVLSVVHKTSIDGVRVILNDAGFPDIPKDWEESNYPKVGYCSQSNDKCFQIWQDFAIFTCQA